MSNTSEVNFQLNPVFLSVRFIIIFFRLLHEEFLDVVFGQQRTTEDAKNFVDISVQTKIMLNNGSKAVSGDSCVNLYSDRVFGVAPECFDTKMLLYKFEEKFDLLTIFVKKSDVCSREIEVIGVKCKCSLEIFGIEHNSSYNSWIVVLISLANKTYRLITQNTIFAVKQVFSFNYFKARTGLLSDDKECANFLNMKESLQVPIATVKDETCHGFVSDPIHSINIINSSFGDCEHRRNISDDIKHGMHLNARLGTSELCPTKQRHTQIDGGGVKSIKTSIKVKLFVNSFSLCDFDHVVGEHLKHMIVSKCVGLRKNTASDRYTPESEMERLLSVSSGNVCQFTQALASAELTEHQNQQLAPMRKVPSGSLITRFLDESFKVSFGKECGHLTEYIFADVHTFERLYVPAKVTISKVRHGF